MGAWGVVRVSLQFSVSDFYSSYHLSGNFFLFFCFIFKNVFPVYIFPCFSIFITIHEVIHVFLLKVMLSKQVLPKPVLPHVEKLNSTNESETLQGKGWSREEKLQPRK